MKQATGTAGRVHVLRLQPDEDVRGALDGWVKEHAIEAASVVSAVGSLKVAHLRYAGRADGIITTGDLEVCLFSGTLSRHGHHLHISIADRNGTMLGGHVLQGCIVRTTLEVVILEVDGVSMPRTQDALTTFNELDPRPLDR